MQRSRTDRRQMAGVAEWDTGHCYTNLTLKMEENRRIYMKKHMLQEFLDRANRDESVYMDEVMQCFSGEPCVIRCTLHLTLGGEKQFEIRTPVIDEADTQAFAFLQDYVYARIYNVICTLGGASMQLSVGDDDRQAQRLLRDLNRDFMIDTPRAERTGYGKCLNVTDRVNAAVGKAPFRFAISHEAHAPAKAEQPQKADAAEVFCRAVVSAQTGLYCGVDIGGTDIKLVGAKNGRICAVKEFDWNPAAFTTCAQLTAPVLLLVRIIRAALSLPDAQTPEQQSLLAKLLEKDAPVEQMQPLLEQLETLVQLKLLDGIGVSFPDVVIDDMIVGGETLKTKGIRDAAVDYEQEFAELRQLGPQLKAFCKKSGHVHIGNDGSLAAFTAAVEWAWEPAHRAKVRSGAFAHTLGTELGSGWIDTTGEIPQIPLEIYNCIIDLGAYSSRRYDTRDVRSVRNFNTGLSGTLQKYTSQYGAYRFAARLLPEAAPEAYQALFDEGYLTQTDAGLFVVMQPKDMRKALLEYLMTRACEGQPQMEQIFREIGRCLYAAWYIAEDILAPAVKSRVLFGRFVKKEHCFRLMEQGVHSQSPVELYAADSSLAYTPLMLDLEHDPVHTVAQFGQAVGAVYFAAMNR